MSASATSNGLDRPVETLAEVGAARARQLRAMGVATLGDLLQYLPRDYRFESEESPITALRDNVFGTARGEVIAVNYVSGRGRPRFDATLDDGHGHLSLMFFNSGYLRQKMYPGLLLRVRAVVRVFRGQPQMINPKWEIVDPTTPVVTQSKFRPIYPAMLRLPSDIIERIVTANLPAALAGVREWFDTDLLDRRNLMGRAQAYRAMHQPIDRDQAIHARRRLVYDELMTMQLAVGLSHRVSAANSQAPSLLIGTILDQRIRARFPFELTTGQNNAIEQIVTDLKSGRPMKRLLQGDVGSGKTVVALYAMLVAVANKMQAALLAPTEVLAEQHFLTLTNLLRGSNVVIELFTSRTRRQSRGRLESRLSQGAIHLAVGTQALLQEKIEFAHLAVVVVDEQHRLGVLQRASLTRQKGVRPHYLVMTATPIPRTLALSYFADFEFSVIEDLPPGRLPIKTRWLRPNQAKEAYQFVRDEVRLGRQAYVVVPQIQDDGLDDAKSVMRHFQHLNTGPLAGLRLAALHGQMATDLKQQTMSDFRQAQIDVLVCTTVIEVGIDVPNATVILIEGAERFGLSQLHQLRGRVGRSSHPSQCILISDASAPNAEARLSAMIKTASGFEIAQMDLQLRGPGEFFGTRQHGLPEFKLTDIQNEMELLELAREDAQAILRDDPRLMQGPHLALREVLVRDFGATIGLAQIG